MQGMVCQQWQAIFLIEGAASLDSLAKSDRNQIRVSDRF